MLRVLTAQFSESLVLVAISGDLRILTELFRGVRILTALFNNTLILALFSATYLSVSQSESLVLTARLLRTKFGI